MSIITIPVSYQSVIPFMKNYVPPSVPFIFPDTLFRHVLHTLFLFKLKMKQEVHEQFLRKKSQ